MNRPKSFNTLLVPTDFSTVSREAHSAQPQAIPRFITGASTTMAMTSVNRRRMTSPRERRSR